MTTITIVLFILTMAWMAQPLIRLRIEHRHRMELLRTALYEVTDDQLQREFVARILEGALPKKDSVPASIPSGTQKSGEPLSSEAGLLAWERLTEEVVTKPPPIRQEAAAQSLDP